jgi:hypothetical protein
MKWGGPPLVWVKDKHEWIELDLTSGEHIDSQPITDEEARRICETGEIPENIYRYMRVGTYEDEGEIQSSY